MKNKLTNLNDYLFAQLERLDDEELDDEELEKAIKRGKAFAETAAQIIAGGDLQLKAMKAAHDMGMDARMPDILLLSEASR